ncbi:MAG: 30S ribosomal protein S2 [Candidatus Nanohaloarchaeota archaeon QJJ-9]|nr:30S ribosomal protein S2 [Candidatus Nanohaloarchaeota archaeon QJJ-9]
MLLDKEEYLSAGVNIGTRRKVEDMEKFIFNVKKNKLAIIDLEKSDERIETAASFLSQYEPEDILIISRKEIGHKPIVKFAEATGAERIFGRFMPGTLTNPNSDEFREPELVMVTDPEEDKQAIKEAVNAKIPIVAICDTVNKSDFIDFVIPANNKGAESLGTIFYLLAREFKKNKGLIDEDEDFDYEIEEFTAEVEEEE